MAELFVGDLLGRSIQKTASPGIYTEADEGSDSTNLNVAALMVKMAILLGADIQITDEHEKIRSFSKYAETIETDAPLEFVEALEKLAKAIESKSHLSIDENLRRLFGGDVDDSDKAMLDELELEFTQLMGQPGA